LAKRRKKMRQRSVPSGTEADVPILSGIALLLSEHPVDKLDLHGLTADQAERRVIAFMERQIVTASGRVIHIITGKGTGSVGASVLPGLVRDLLDYDLADLVRERAGLPGGGGVAVRLR
jgi:DNA-nicking Smr family endonuclease